jgi:hypothetical protein
MEGTTSIDELPNDPANGGNINIKLSDQGPPASIPQVPNADTSTQSGSMALDQTTINQIVNGLQQASSSGATQLQSRDIPQNTASIVQDPSVQQEYIPQPPPEMNVDYIKSEMDNEDILNTYANETKTENTLDQMYEELQIPLLIGVLYFLFQLPIVRSTFNKYFPALFSKDGNQNIYGLMAISCAFAFAFYMLSKTVSQFGKF